MQSQIYRTFQKFFLNNRYTTCCKFNNKFSQAATFIPDDLNHGPWDYMDILAFDIFGTSVDRRNFK